VIGRGGGADTILDFDVLNDTLVLEDGVAVRSQRVGDVDGDGDADLTIAFAGGGGSVTLLDVASVLDLPSQPADFEGLNLQIVFNQNLLIA